MAISRKITGLPLPETPKEAPLEVHALVQGIEDALADEGSIRAAHLLAQAFEYLTRYFAGVSGAAAHHLQVYSDELEVPLDFEEARLKLRERLTALGDQATDPLSRLVRGVFFVGATRSVPTPRRHARLLDLGGIPIRGYLSIGEWIAIEPGTEELASEAKANRELLRYLPILKEWITATANYFLDSKQTELYLDSDNLLRFRLSILDVDFAVGPIALSGGLSDFISCLHQKDPEGAADDSDLQNESVVSSLRATEVEQEKITPSGAKTYELAAARDETLEVEAADVAVAVEAAVAEAADAIASTDKPLVVEASEPVLAVEFLEVPVTGEALPTTEAVRAEEQGDEGGAHGLPGVAGSEKVVDEPATDVAVAPDADVALKANDAVVAPDADVALKANDAVVAPDADVALQAQDAAIPDADVALQAQDAAISPDADVALKANDAVVAPDADVALKAQEAVVAPDADVALKAQEAAFAPDASAVVVGLSEAEVAMESMQAEGADADSDEEELLDNPFLEPVNSPVEHTVVLNLEELKQKGLDLSAGGIAKGEPRPYEVLTQELEGESPELAEQGSSIDAALKAEDVEVKEQPKAIRVPPVLPFQRDNAKEKSISKEPASSQPQPLLYPVASGPPPEFFDELQVDADCPEVLREALTDLNGAIESNDSFLICGQMQRSFDLMIQFFAGITASILDRVDSESLLDFDLESARLTFDSKLELLVFALSSLEEHWESNDAGMLLWSAFYDTALPATDPNWTYLHTRLLGVEGAIPKGFLDFSELCALVPGKGKLGERSACRELIHNYLPILAIWLENANPLFIDGEVDFVDEDDGLAFSWAASLGGQTLDGTAPGLWVEVAPDRWNLPRPEFAPLYVIGGAPDVLVTVIDELNVSLERGNYSRAGTLTRLGLDFLIQYFAGCAAAHWREQSSFSEEGEALYHSGASLEEKEKLLGLALEHVSTATELGANLLKVFSKNSIQYRVFLHHQKLRPEETLVGWLGLGDDVSEEELLCYLPLLRAWLGASNPWFGGGEQLFEEPSADGLLEGVIVFGEDYLEMVEPEYVIALAPELIKLLQVVEDGDLELAEADGADELLADAKDAQEGLLAEGALDEHIDWPSLETGPPMLLTYLERLSQSAGNLETVNAWLGGSLEYLIQYFAGLVTTLIGGKQSQLALATLAYFQPRASLREREILLVEGISILKDGAQGETQERVRAVFFDEDGRPLLHSKMLGVGGPLSLAEGEVLLSFFCRTRHKHVGIEGEDFRFALRVLTSWCSAASSFFELCEHYAEPPEGDGQEEIVIEIAQDYLDLALPDYCIQVPSRDYFPILYRELEAAAADEAAAFFPEDVRPELLGAKSQILGGAASGEDELLLGAVTSDLDGDDMFGGAAAFDSSELFQAAGLPKPKKTEKIAQPDSPYARKKQTGTVKLGSEAVPVAIGLASASTVVSLTEEAIAEAESEAAGRRRKQKRAKKSELSHAMLELYKKERLEKARKRVEARARKNEVSPTKLESRIVYKGLKNSKQLGSRCHFGLIELRNIGGGQLKGTIEPNHPSIKVTPSRFQSNEVRVSYQIDPSDMPSTGRVGLSFITQDERIEIHFSRLVPTSWLSKRPLHQALSLMTMPAALFMVIFSYMLAFWPGGSLLNAFDSLGAQDSLALKHKLLLWFFSTLSIGLGAIVAPALVKKIFVGCSYDVQEGTRKFLPFIMLLPFLLLMLILNGTSLWSLSVPLSRLPALANKVVLETLFVGVNLLAGALFYSKTHIWWEDKAGTSFAQHLHLGFGIVVGLLGFVTTLILSMF